MRLLTSLIALTLASGCAPLMPPADPSAADFRAWDARLLDQFAALKRRCAPRWADDAECAARLGQLRREELQLFSEVRSHRFSDVTESNYWHRGRLKFPSEIEQALDQVDDRWKPLP